MISTVKKLFIFLLISSIFACSPKAVKKSDNPGDLYVEGINFMKAKKYDKAIENFSRIRENFPFDPISFIATVKLGDVYFERKEYVLASGVYEDFLNAHPDDENVPYVLKRLGDCYEKLSLPFDRDQAYTLKALDRYTFLKNRFPSSSYTKEGEKRIEVLEQKLADRELSIGEFYFNTYRYNAAIIRLEYFLKKYPKAQGQDKALYYLSLSYQEMGDLQKSDFYFERLRSEYPKSPLLRGGVRERKTLRLATADTPLYAQETIKKRDIPLNPQVAAPTKKGEKEDKLTFFDESKPIDIVSDTMEGFDKEKYVVFKGNVVARQEDLFIFSDTIEAQMNENTNEIEKAHAKGNVKIIKNERTATCNEAIFDNGKGEIILKGNVVVYTDRDRLTGEVVRYLVKEDRVIVEGEKPKRARITITPK
ncbi:MAG: lipopolysaccharide transport periplasmic protein LptA [Syntrophorhabdaceae bacterium]|nr:lipopolysaccharide transport periplasmic protein LptA [Syntrophorhabdaceae bacterium]